MFRTMLSPKRISGKLAVAATVALSVIVASWMTLRSEERVPGLTESIDPTTSFKLASCLWIASNPR
jgi:hypothetical protein